MLKKERNRTKDDIVGGVLDTIDPGHELARIAKKEIWVLTSFCASTESYVDLIFVPTCVTQLTKSRTFNVAGP